MLYVEEKVCAVVKLKYDNTTTAQKYQPKKNKYIF